MLELDDGVDDQAVLAAATATGPGHEFARRRPSLADLFRGLMLAATAVFTWLGGRVYAGAVLRSGSRVTLREALSGS